MRSMLNLILGIKLGTYIGLNTINRMALGSSRWLIENLGDCERVCEGVCVSLCGLNEETAEEADSHAERAEQRAENRLIYGCRSVLWHVCDSNAE